MKAKVTISHLYSCQNPVKFNSGTETPRGDTSLFNICSSCKPSDFTEVFMKQSIHILRFLLLL